MATSSRRGDEPSRFWKACKPLLDRSALRDEVAGELIRNQLRELDPVSLYLSAIGRR
jgi:hypothetical protein